MPRKTLDRQIYIFSNEIYKMHPDNYKTKRIELTH